MPHHRLHPVTNAFVWLMVIVQTLAMAARVHADPAQAASPAPTASPSPAVSAARPALKVSGFTQVSYTAGSAHSSNLPVGFDDHADDVLLQQNWLTLDQSAIAGGPAPSYGFRADLILPGSDYRYTRARGLLDGQTATTGIDPVYFYLDAQYPKIAKGMELQVGRFSALFGEESNEATKNELGSHSYTFIFNPFTHTGLVTTTRLSDRLAFQAGLVLGSDVFIDPADRATFTGSVTIGPADLSNTTQLTIVQGPGRFDTGHGFNNPNLVDLLYSRKLSKRLSSSFEALYGYESDVPLLGSVHWYGLVPYLTCSLNSRLSLTGRLELFGDAEGQRTGFAGQYRALTIGLNRKAGKRWKVRGELRDDRNGESTPFEGRHDLFTASTDVIYLW